MQIGKLKHPIVIQSKVVTRNEYGEEQLAYNTFANCWAKIEPLSGREFFMAQQAHSELTHKITIRYKEGIRPDYRAIYGTRIFNIQSVINVNEGNYEMVLYCTEVQKDIETAVGEG